MIVKPKHRKLVLNLKDPNRVLNVIPTAGTIRYKGQRLVVVPHRLDEVRVLRNMGFDAPSPIDYYYDWPARFTPFYAQYKTAAFFTLYRRGYCLNDMGTGKTMSLLWAWDFLRQEGLTNKLLVVAPLSTLESTWGDEIFTHLPHLKFGVVHGDRARRQKILAQNYDVFIVNHDGVKVISEDLQKRPDIDAVVIDELSEAARNAGTDRWKTFKKTLSKRAWLWGMTGTPTPKSPEDAWAQCRLITPDTVPPYFSRFRDQVMKQVGPYKWVQRDGAMDHVYNVMQPAVRFKRSDCTDLPDMMYETRHVPLTKEQEKAYSEMLNKLQSSYQGGEFVALNEGVKMAKLVQISVGAVYDTNGTPVIIPTKPRLEEAAKLVSESPSKTIVYVPFTAALQQVATYLRQWYSVEVIYGDVSKTERARIFGAFQKSPDPQVLVAQPSAMSHGLTLTAAAMIVWFAPTTRPDTYQQANGRTNRAGQKHDQLICHLEGTPVERRMYARLKDQEHTQGVLLDMMEQNKSLAT